MQAAAMQIIYKGVFQWFLKLIVGVQFTDCRFLKKEKQFIILANHNSHLEHHKQGEQYSFHCYLI